MVCFCGGREPGCAPGGAVTFFCFAKRKSPKKRRPSVCDPCASLRGKPASGRLRGSPHNSLRACGAPFGQTRRVSSRSMRAPTRMPPRKHPAAGAASKGLNTRRPHGPSLRSALLRGRKRLALARQAERSDGPCGCWAPTPPSGCACGAQGMADQGSRLSERRRREFERDPASTEHRRLRVIGVRHPFHCGAQHRTLRASRRLGELGL